MFEDKRSIRVLIVYENPLLCEGLIAILETYQDLEVVGAVSDGSGALAAAAELKPDTVLISVRTPGGGLPRLVRRLREVSSRFRVLVLSEHDAPDMVRNLLSAGVSGYLLKSTTKHQLIAAIRGAYAADEGISLFVSQHSLTQINHEQKVLSARERDVLELVAVALSNSQVAARLSVSEATVKRHLRNIFVKLGAVSRIDAVNKAVAAAEISPLWGEYAESSLCPPSGASA